MSESPSSSSAEASSAAASSAALRVGPSGPRGRPGVVALVIVALLGVFGTVFFYGKYHRLQHRDDLASTVKRVSTDFLNTFTNFNANTLDSQFNQVQTMATGDFADQWRKYAATNVRATLASVQATSRGQIRFIAVESVDSSNATTFAEIDQTIANLKFSHPEQDVLRLTLTLQRVSGQWKVSEVTVLQGPAALVPPASSTPSTSTPTTTSPPTGK
ncbi:MAG TPA: hypothetical protein VFA96_05655 [Nocardioides sp.]|nr:hypothetical protein [Nocardioides sp.]